jgi:hypothetical protein
MALTLVLTPATTVAGQDFLATATSTPAVPGETITFTYGAVVKMANADVTGVASTTFTALATGPVVAVGPTSGTAFATETVTAAPNCTVTVTSSPANPTAGQPVTLTATVLCNGVPVQNALVSLTAGGVSLGANLTSPLGTVDVTTNLLPVGTNTVIATVVSLPLGSPCLCVGITGNVTVVVTPAATCAVTLTSSPANPTTGQPVTLTATVTCSGAPVAGATVLFTGPGGLSTSATTNAVGVATTTTSALPAGANTIIAIVNAAGGTCTCTNVIATTTVVVGGPSQTFTAQPACYTVHFPPFFPYFSTTTLSVTGATPGATITFHSDGPTGPVLCTAVADTFGNASCTIHPDPLTLGALVLSGYSATTPVPGGQLSSSSTVRLCGIS